MKVVGATFPVSTTLDIAAFSRLFANTTTAYKILFFRTLIEEFQSSAFTQSHFDLDVLMRGMLIRSWYPRVFHHLSFGVSDQLGSVLVQLGVDEGLGLNYDKLSACLQSIEMPKEARKLLRYVPLRLLRPFYASALRGEKDSNINGLIQVMSLKTWNTDSPPLYRLQPTSSSQMLELHPAWMDYLGRNFAIILDWCKWSWVSYLQAFNPNAPAIVAKIDPPRHREPLKWQTRFWRKVIAQGMTYCPYTGELLSADDFQLDHFIPWSLIGHDQMWNLIPVSALANASKGNQLPDAQYLKALAETHYNGLHLPEGLVSDQDLRRYHDDHVTGLSLSDAIAVSPEFLLHSYEHVVLPLLQIGENSGFRSEWRLDDTPR